MDGLNNIDDALCKFKTFLLNEGVLDLYLYNIRKDLQNGYRFRADEFIVGAFTWLDTKEGHEFWGNLDKKWVKQASYVNKYYYHTEMVKALETVENDYWED